MSNRQSRKHPLGECLGENSGEPQTKRRRNDNIVFLRGSRRPRRRVNPQPGRGISHAGEPSSSTTTTRRITRTGKRKQPEDLGDPLVSAVADENDIINELTNEFKKARLRPVFFTISSFIEQTVDEVGFTMVDEPDTEVTISLKIKRNSGERSTSNTSDEVRDEEINTSADHTSNNASVSQAGEDKFQGYKNIMFPDQSEVALAQFVFTFRPTGDANSTA